MKTAICVGHSRMIGTRRDGGAFSTHLGVNERDFNLRVVEEMKRLDPTLVVLDKYEGRSYKAAMQWLADSIRSAGCNVAVELHFNSATPAAKGHEWLYWLTSKRGMALASCFRKAFRDAFPEIVDRGIKPKGAGDRGAEFLRLTHCPSVIVEPFFGSSGWDCAVIDKKGHKAVASAYVSALKAYHNL
jgi:N-acetylmuramoyl-L-alanine amidase